MTIGLFRPAGNLFILRNSNSFGSPDMIVSITRRASFGAFLIALPTVRSIAT